MGKRKIATEGTADAAFRAEMAGLMEQHDRKRLRGDGKLEVPVMDASGNRVIERRYPCELPDSTITRHYHPEV